MTTWAELRSHALVGLARRPVGAIVAAGHAVDVDPARSGPVAVLDAAALLAIQRRAGAMGVSGPTAPDPAPSDRPVPSPSATQLLEVLLGGATGRGAGTDVLLRRWFAGCAGAGKRVPDHLLVAVLDAGTARESLRVEIRGALGGRGEWLAALNPAWSWVAGLTSSDDGGVAEPVDVDEWSRLTKAERVAAVERLRSHDPAAGRALVESTWSSDKALDREAHLLALTVGLGPDDDALLEAALDDRSVRVRSAALDLLDRLPTSQRAARMSDRLRPLIQTGGMLRKKLVVELPDDPDESATRDGVLDVDVTGSRRAHWLRQLTLAAPLATWVEATDRSPAELVAMAVDPPEVAGWWAHAAAVQRDPAWAAAVMAVRPLPELVPLLPSSEAATIVESHVTRRSLRGHLAVSLAAALPGRWSPSLSVAVLDAVRTWSEAKEQTSTWVLPGNVDVLVDKLAPEAVAVVERWRTATIPDETDTALRTIQQALTTIDAIDRAFTPGAPT